MIKLATRVKRPSQVRFFAIDNISMKLNDPIAQSYTNLNAYMKINIKEFDAQIYDNTFTIQKDCFRANYPARIYDFH
jgi:hypothetical protein